MLSITASGRPYHLSDVWTKDQAHASRSVGLQARICHRIAPENISCNHGGAYTIGIHPSFHSTPQVLHHSLNGLQPKSYIFAERPDSHPELQKLSQPT